MARHVPAILVVIAACATLAGCGGGGGAFSTTTGGTATAIADKQVFADATGNLYAAAPRVNPNLVRLDSGVEGATVVPGAAYDAAAAQLRAIAPRVIVYVKAGRLYRAQRDATSAFAPVQVSSEATLTPLCGGPTVVAIDWANPDNSLVSYVAPGALPGCHDGDEVRRLVRVGMNSGAVPIDVGAKALLAPTYDGPTGAVTGFVAVDGAALEHCDTSLLRCNVMTTFNNAAVPLALYYASGSWKLALDVDGRLRVYDNATQTLGAALYTFAASPTGLLADANALYFLDGTRVVKFPFGGTPLVLTTESDRPAALALTATNVVYLSASRLTLKAVAKGGGTPQVVLALAGANALTLDASAGERVYYHYGDAAGAVLITAPFTRTKTTRARWLGGTVAATLSFNQTPYTLPPAPVGGALLRAGVAARVVRAEACPSSVDCAGATVASYDAPSFGASVSLGNLGADTHDLVVSLLGDAGLASAATDSGIDLYYLAAGTAQSLTRMTRTPGIDEFPVQP